MIILIMMKVAVLVVVMMRMAVRRKDRGKREQKMAKIGQGKKRYIDRQVLYLCEVREN